MARKVSFRRTDGHKYSKLGVRRKKKQVYRKAKGIDNKIRLSRRHRPRKVKIGFKNEKKGRGLINEMEVVMVYNIEDLKKIKEKMIGLVGKIGNKKKKDIAERVVKDKIKLLNLNAEKFLKALEDKMNKTKDEKVEREKKKKVRDKKSKEKEDKEKKEAEKKKEKEDKKGEDKLEEKVEEKKESEKDTDNLKQDKKSESQEDSKSSSKDLEDTKKETKKEETKTETKSKEEGK